MKTYWNTTNGLSQLNPPRIFERSKKNVYGCEDWHFGKSSRLLACSFRVIIVHVLVLLICPAKIHIFDESLYFPTLFFAIGMCFFHFFGIFHLTDRKCRQETTAFLASDNRHRQESPQETVLIRNLDKDMVKTVTILALFTCLSPIRHSPTLHVAKIRKVPQPQPDQNVRGLKPCSNLPFRRLLSCLLPLLRRRNRPLWEIRNEFVCLKINAYLCT